MVHQEDLLGLGQIVELVPILLRLLCKGLGAKVLVPDVLANFPWDSILHYTKEVILVFILLAQRLYRPHVKAVDLDLRLAGLSELYEVYLSHCTLPVLRKQITEFTRDENLASVGFVQLFHSLGNLGILRKVERIYLHLGSDRALDSVADVHTKGDLGPIFVL